LRKQHQPPAGAAEWKRWAQNQLADIGDTDIAAGIAPLGPIADGHGAIEAARKLWTQQYGGEQVTIAAPYRSYRQNRTEERRGGKEGVSKCKSRWGPAP